MPIAPTGVEGRLPSTSPRITRRIGVAWSWAAVACSLLATSGLVRAYQDGRHHIEKSYKETCPIDLAKVPMKLGAWQVVGGGEQRLDDLTMRISGATDHTIRTYANELTGVSLNVLFLFGPAEPVMPHTPEICYPSSGFKGGEDLSDRTIDFPKGKDGDGRPAEGHARFRSASYHKATGRATLREAVYYSFRLDGQWSNSIGSGRRFARRNPGIFKVQVQRRMGVKESIGEGDPIEGFLSVFLAEVEEKIKASASNGPAPG